MEQSLDTRAVTLTKTFCNHLAATTYESLTPAAVRECKRGILDWLGCALAGSPHPEIDITLETLKLNGGRPVATVIGRGLKLGLLEAPIANGQMGHLLDYDDTHMGGVVLHASSPILAALFALAEHLDEVRGAANPVRTPVSGREFMLAYATGFEAGVRVGRTAPGHHDGGWHLTGTLGTIAAGAACAKLLGLTGQQMTYTLAIAATQAAGMQQNRGTMCKSLHAGKAASNGLLAALLASKGFDGTQEIVEGNKGFGRIYSKTCEPDRLVEDLGGPWVIECVRGAAASADRCDGGDEEAPSGRPGADRGDRAEGASAGAEHHRRVGTVDGAAVEVLVEAFGGGGVCGWECGDTAVH